MLTAMLHRVSYLDPSYAREIFLTVIKRNQRAVELYQNLSLRTVGENTTYLGKDAAAKFRPIVWYQMGLRRENGIASGGAHTPPSNKKPRSASGDDDEDLKTDRKRRK